MAGLILLAMIAMPIIEIAVFIEAGEAIGLWSTIGIVILTAFVGTALLRHQGLATLARVRDSMDAGRLPVEELFDGLCLLIAGALLLTPGFVTDGFGLLLFAPPFRALLRTAMARHMTVRTHAQGPRSTTTIIEGEYNDITPNDTQEPNDGDKPQDRIT
ncbi:MAG: FxsA family protein [Rhodospirillaceae bacterium]|jgi:UPF0716 protein FxsA|nr:FxsA family protein [Rhodospirillaceae bacterium]MBT4219888.1 FxsA family protein [Rhodospirillaceae bacterium]MBT4463814.1 FxsA family protein [Rhodospirillaceae bacterium]MBT5013684.1 FxsA family protein [Rhodospirillaceae bacterium]MBT5308466.1 FxsA family protein [Rhodospirillaceae bacterium]